MSQLGFAPVIDDADRLPGGVAGPFEAADRHTARISDNAALARELFVVDRLQGVREPNAAAALKAIKDHILESIDADLPGATNGFVPHDHPDSNFRMARDAFLSWVPVPGDNVRAVPTEGVSPEEAAAAYESTLKRFYGSDRLAPDRPLFDVTLRRFGHSRGAPPAPRAALVAAAVWPRGFVSHVCFRHCRYA